MAEWWSIEVLHGEFSAFRWQEQHDSVLIEAALTNGAVDGSWHAGSWGVVFEVLFETEEQWQAFRNLLAVRAPGRRAGPGQRPVVYRGRAAEQASANRASQSRNLPRALCRCPCPKPSHCWT